MSAILSRRSCLSLLGAASCARTAPQTQDGEARAIWERMILAKGGRQRLEQVTSLALVSKEHMLSIKRGVKDTDVESVTLLVFPNLIWDWFDGGTTKFGLSLSMVDTERRFGYLVQRGVDGAKAKESFVSAIRGLLEFQAVFFSETKWFKPEPVRRLSELETGKKLVGVETRLPASGIGILSGYRADFILDAETYLPIRLLHYQFTSDAKDRTHVSEYSMGDYRLLDGIQIPHKYGLRHLGSPHEGFVKKYDDVMLDVPYRQGAFDEVPSLKDGPFGWSPTRRKPEGYSAKGDGKHK